MGFIRIFPKEFKCMLCNDQRWSLLTNDPERHMKANKHKVRLEQLKGGALVRIDEVGLEPSRFYDGLRVRGDVYTRETVEQARALIHVDVATSEGVTLEILR